MSQSSISDNITIALTWCLAWGSQRQPQYPYIALQEMQRALKNQENLTPELQPLLEQVQKLASLPEQPETLTEIQEHFPDICQQNTPIGLVYGGVTKVKSYVFESAKLSEIRGASALLDKINLVDLPAFFNKLPPEADLNSKLRKPLEANCVKVRNWLDKNFPDLSQALIPELIIYSTGGNILAFCPADFVDDLANAIEKRYTEETITANSCAVGDTFRLLEIRLGLLTKDLGETKWFEWYKNNQTNPLIKAYFGLPETEDKDPKNLFFSRKSFNELAGKLASEFQKRRNGNDTPNRPSRRYPVILETHPYLIRDGSDRASAIFEAKLPNTPYFSEPLARKRFVGQIAKNEHPGNWYPFDWKPEEGTVRGWVTKFEDDYLKREKLADNYYQETKPTQTKEAQTLAEIGNSSNGFVAFIYADGNNMGGYIQKIKTPEAYQKFSQDVSVATEQSVYRAIEKHLKPHKLKDLPKDKESVNKNGDYIHPFEIITIGGDDVMLIVPANKALEIAHTIALEFERILLERDRQKYLVAQDEVSLTKWNDCHRYKIDIPQPEQCKLSTSIGVLITSTNTPIYYAQKLTQELLTSAKKKAKYLKKQYKYFGGTIDFMVLKSVTMIAGTIESFRKQGLEKKIKNSQTVKLYASPYTIFEIEALIKTIRAFKSANFPRSQLYQIRSLLEQGKRTAILNYLYFRVRLKKDKQPPLINNFEKGWCIPNDPEENKGNLAPWMYDTNNKNYETIWREIVDLYDFISEESVKTQPVMESSQ